MSSESAPTIFIECTLTHYAALNSGVQRVVRNVLRHAAAAAERRGYAVSPVYADGGRFFEADISAVLRDKQRAADANERNERPGLFRHALQAGEYLVRKAMRLTVTLLPFDPVLRLVYGPTARRRLARLLRLRSSSAKGGKIIDPRPGDILLLLDASWAIPNPWPAVRHFKQYGGRIVSVIYDLIPLDHPQACAPEHVAVFRTWLKQLVRFADAYVCISSSVARRLSEYLGSQPRSDVRAVGHFRLGSELDLLTSSGGVRSSVTEIFSASRHSFIVVGSIEPRKNHAFILEAFDAFWRAGGDASLVVIGHPGWKGDKILDSIVKHPELNRRLFLIRDASDTDLNYAYHRASALVIASQAEGFGLPIVEAFQRGLPVLCSNIPVFREVADGKAQFFALDDPRHLANALSHFCRANATSHPGQRVPQPWPAWRESTEELFSVVLKLASAANTDKPKEFANP